MSLEDLFPIVVEVRDPDTGIPKRDAQTGEVVLQTPFRRRRKKSDPVFVEGPRILWDTRVDSFQSGHRIGGAARAGETTAVVAFFGGS